MAEDKSPDAATDVEQSAAPAPEQELSHQSPSRTKRKRPPRSTIAGRSWVTLAFSVVVIVLLIIFIAENSHRATVHFLGASGSISLALALLIAAVAGAVIMLLVGSTRILQLRREVKRRL